MIKVNVRVDDPELLPVRGSQEAAGWDLKAKEGYVLYPGKGNLFKTGVYLEMEPGVHAEIRPRSGLSTKHHLIIPNSPGTIDSDYRGELMVYLLNVGEKPVVVEEKDRIAQMVFIKHEDPIFNLTENLNETERGDGGFGSTGVA